MQLPFSDSDNAADQEGIADLEAGHIIPHDRMKTWLLSWGTSEETPPPESD
ncbi:CopG family transcriptional regulator [Caulobacter endophyticus]|nr:CopG family transcriptional regulator [Caulobacter endophyticus]MDG2529421.1 CopG family transcriptional regulator [Caulobacter endophyticus]